MQEEERKSAHHELMGGKLHVYKRENSQYWQCSTYLGGKNRRVSTGEESLQHAKDFAEDWYLELKGKSRAGQLREGKAFRVAAKQFELEYEVITEGQRSKDYVQGQKDRLRVHLLPFFRRYGPLRNHIRKGPGISRVPAPEFPHREAPGT